jgi:pimeloyl-ACP methyl ester carboxylesterase
MRDTPEHIRSVVLDSTVPVQAPLTADWAANLEHALNRLFADCATDPACAAAYPNVEETLYALVHQFDAAPATLRPIDPATGEAFDVVLTGHRLLIALQQTLFRTDYTPLIPLIVASTAAGDYTLLTVGYAALPASLRFAYGMQNSVRCGEEVPFVTQQVVTQATANVRPEIRDVGLALVTQFRLDVCDFWDMPQPAAIEHEAVASDIPTLILAGEYDPITPPYYGEQAAQTLTQSHFFEFRGFGHGELRAQSAETARPRCAMQLASAFLDDPLAEPDGSCVESLPAPRFAVN